MWIVFALLGAITAAIVVVLSKAGLKNLDSSLAFAIESVLILIIAWSAVFIQKTSSQLAGLKTKEWWYLIIAGILTAVSSLFTFRALKIGNASMVNPIERVSLVFVVVLSALFLKEKLTWQIMLGATLMAAGAIIIAVSGKSNS